MTDYADYETAMAHADAARERHMSLGEVRAAARAQSLKGNVLLAAGRYGAARIELVQALEVLRPEPDEDTVTALGNLAALEVRSGNPVEGDRLAAEGLALGQALGVDDQRSRRPLHLQGHGRDVANRQVEAAGYYETAARLAERAGDLGALSRAQLNLADALVRSDPHSAVEAARSAADHARDGPVSAYRLGVAVANLAVALVELDQWDEAEAVVHEAVQVEHLGHELVHCVSGVVGWTARRRRWGRAALEAGAPPIARAKIRKRRPRPVSSKPLWLSPPGISIGALAHAMGVLESGAALGIGHDFQRWAWPLAARTARRLRDEEALGALVAMLDAQPVGYLPPVLLAERQLVGALAAADAHRPDALALVADAVAALRKAGNPYQLAHGLIDYAEMLLRDGEDGPDALAEARQIAEGLRCRPLLERADASTASARADSAN